MPEIFPAQIWVSDPGRPHTERLLRQMARRRCGLRRSATGSRARPIFPRWDLGRRRCALIKKTSPLIARSTASAADVRPAIEPDGLCKTAFHLFRERKMLENVEP